MHTAPPRPGMLRALTIALAAVVALLALTAAASAATLHFNRACYVFFKHRPVVSVTGSGYTPGDPVVVQSPSGFDVSVTADSAGDIAGHGPAPIPPLAAKAKEFSAKAVEFGSGGSEATVATASSHVAAFAASHGAGKHKAPGDRALAEKVKWAFSGFPVHHSIYGHYLHAGRLVAAQRFGRAKAPCGTLVVHRRGYPGDPHHSSYKVQLDSHSKYSPKTAPRLLLKVALTIF